VDGADLFDWPVDEGGFAVDELAVDGAEVAAVAGDGAVVAHDPVLVREEDHFGLGAVVGEALGDVGLSEQLAVDEDAAVVDAQAVAGEGDDALDVTLGEVVGVLEDDDVALVDLADAVGDLIDEEAVLIFKHRQHAGAFDADRLVEEDDDEGGDDNGDDEVKKPVAADRAGIWPGPGRGPWLAGLLQLRAGLGFVGHGWLVG